MKDASLFERLGGTPGINAIVADVVSLHMKNPVVGARFRPLLENPDKLKVVTQHLCNFLEAGSGGKAAYTGRSMPDAHRGMNISAAEYMAAVDDIMAALRKHQRDEQTQKDVLAITWSLKGEMLHL